MMKKLLVVSVAICLLFFSVSVFAASGLSTVEKSVEETERFLNNITLTVVKNEPDKKSIQGFDVNEDGLVAVASTEMSKGQVSIYNSDGTFLYGYIFSCNQSIEVEWQKNGLSLYFIKSDVAATFDENGNAVEVRTIENTIENNSYLKNVVQTTKKEVNGRQYIVTSDGLLAILSPNYTKLIVKDSDGSERVIYDASTRQIIKIICFAVLFIVVLTVTIIRIVSIKRKNAQQNPVH